MSSSRPWHHPNHVIIATMSLQPCYHHDRVIIKTVSSSRPYHHHDHVIIATMSSSRPCHYDHVIITTVSSSRPCHHHDRIIITTMSSSRPCHHRDRVIIATMSSRSSSDCLVVCLIIFKAINFLAVDYANSYLKSQKLQARFRNKGINLVRLNLPATSAIS